MTVKKGTPDERNPEVYGDDYDDNTSAAIFEKSRIRVLAVEREDVQKKTFTKWVNSHLVRVNCRIQDLYMDMRDGRMLMKLLEVLSGERLPKVTPGKMRIHCLENVDKGLQFLRDQHVHLENLGSQDIVDGSPMLTLGMIWTIILRFQIQDITFEDIDNQETRSAKEALLLWCQMKTAGYANVNVKNFTTSWKDGLAFNALIHKHRPELIEYEKLKKSDALNNLNSVFDIAESRLGLTKFLDAEDVNIPQPDEKSIITYIVTFYHYFNKIKQEIVQARRIGRVISDLMDNEQLKSEYELSVSDLLEWIQRTIVGLNARTFENNLEGVQGQLTLFNNYRINDKPPKFAQKGELEVLLFTLQSKLKANNQKVYKPKEGMLIAGVNKAWSDLEKAEHGRELALKEELIRQEKLEQLAARFDKKAEMRENWITENQKLVTQDNFGTNFVTTETASKEPNLLIEHALKQVEAATKKQEAIETDIYAYEDRVRAVVAVANELEQERYHDFVRINEEKEKILRLWNELLELIVARRSRLELCLGIQQIFHDMVIVLGTTEEIKNKLLNGELGQHLMDCEDLLQKQDLLESDINIVGDRIRDVNNRAEKYTYDDGPEGTGYQPADPSLVKERINILKNSFDELIRLAAERRAKLDENRKLCQFLWDLQDLENTLKEQENVLSLTDTGKDVASVQRHLAKLKNAENNLDALSNNLDDLDRQGTQLQAEQIPGSENIDPKLAAARNHYNALRGLAAQRRDRLTGNVEYYQFFTDADDVDACILDHLRVISSEDVGRDEGSTSKLLQSVQGVTDEIELYEKHIQTLEAQAASLPIGAREHPDIRHRLATTTKKKTELEELARMRKQRLVDALTLYKLLADADAIESWIDEKGKLLATLAPAQDVDDKSTELVEVEIMRHRFRTLEDDMAHQQAKLGTVNELARQLLHVDHPNSDEILERQNRLNARWAQLKDMVDQKRSELERAHRLGTFRIDCQETVTWIEDKTRVLEDTDELTTDLSGVMRLQRRLSMMERDLGAIQAKLDCLHKEAEAIEKDKPQQAELIKQDIKRIEQVWEILNTRIRENEARLDEAGDLQRFLRDLDHFQQWLTNTSRLVASEEEPVSQTDAEQLLHQHEAIREEIDGYADDYSKMRAMGDRVTQDQTDPTYMFLRERLKELSTGWSDLQTMWENKHRMLSEGLNLQLFLRDAKQAEVSLAQQENFLAKEEIPQSLEQAEKLLKRHQDFMTTMDANDEKINAVVQFGENLTQQSHYASDRIYRKASNIQEKRADNRAKAQAQLEKLEESLALQRFLSDCEELREWIEEKMIRAQDETYRDAKTITSKFMRHQAFQSELSANKERLDQIKHAAEKLTEDLPDFSGTVAPQLDDLSTQWQKLEKTTEEKGQKLFDANRQQLYVQSINDMKDWAQQLEQQMIQEDPSKDLTTVNMAMQKQCVIESEMSKKTLHLESLKTMEPQLEEMHPEEVEQIKAHRLAVAEQLHKLKAPLEDRRKNLERKKAAYQFIRDVDDEKLYIQERLPAALAQNLGDNLFDCHRLQKNLQSLRNEVDNHENWINEITKNGEALVESGYGDPQEFKDKIKELQTEWTKLKDIIDQRKDKLADSEKAHQYLYDCNEAEAWMSEQELYMMQDERGKDEFSTQNQIKNHERLLVDILQYSDTIKDLSNRAEKFINEKSPLSDQIAIRQSQIEKLYAGLKDLCKERRARLDETLQLYELHREIDDLLQWIADKEVVAGSGENGQDYEHVQMLQERFNLFARDTEAIGSERVDKANDNCDELINDGHTDAPMIALWKDSMNEAWENLLELIDTRSQMLEISRQCHKFYHDCRDCISRIIEKTHALPDDLGRDSSTVGALSRKHQNFLKDVEAIGESVKQIEEDAHNLRDSYAGDKALDIAAKEQEVLKSWKNLKSMCDARNHRLIDTSDLFKFLNMVRDLLAWMDEVKREMSSHDRPKDVSGVELLMNNHQSLKAEVDARESNFSQCLTLGRDLLNRKHYASSEIEKKLIKLTTERTEMMRRWEDRWEYLQLILEVYQFARDAAVAESWLNGQEPYLMSTEYGRNLEETINLIKKHEAFEKSSAAQHERFLALEKLTTFELKEIQRKQLDRAEEERRRRGSTPSKAHDKSYETTFPATSEPRSQGFDDRSRNISEPYSGWRMSLSRSQRFDTKDSRGAFHGDAFEGVLIRKHTFESLDKKASNRSWDKVYAVLQNHSLSFFKDTKHREENLLYHGEPPLDLQGCSVSPADYSKKKFVLSVRLPVGSEYLLQCANEDDMHLWESQLHQATGQTEGEDARSQTMLSESSQPATTSAATKTKKGGFFSRGKKEKL
uniref:Spectrin beta chain n=1 Tax=Rhabditophanes sp. KR3021 TaxID=114890 RepID=A0AC35TJQ1_9BILA